MNAHSLSLLGILLFPTLLTSAAEPPMGFAVVELFTSEGCSSCPPADRVLAEVSQRNAKDGTIYCLGFHVDYWNKLGWNDRFSSAEATQRQQNYARHFGSDRVYTPQMIVNGTNEFVGSNRKLCEDALSAALQTKPLHALTVVAKPPTEQREIAITIRATGNTSDTNALLALVQRQGENRVTRGENEGRKLVHVGIVRDFQAAKLNAGGVGTTTLTLPSDLRAADVDLIGFLQNRETAAITAASKISVPNR